MQEPGLALKIGEVGRSIVTDANGMKTEMDELMDQVR